ncbi:MAG TPA: efflux RND transporter periplasmic adaptor subunit [Kofleriaceae bacterium]|jgi:RND family efflux transporter MFP subunit|nr:efflux RND transporter periplasmic adaptor subunit [Kofleriaceae bacterium]
MNGEPLPLARAGSARWSRTVSWIVAAVVASVAVILARAYQRPAPVLEPPTPGMKVGSDSVTLAPGAPPWAVIEVKRPEPPQPNWAAPIPARVVFDESRTARLGTPLAGRVSAVHVAGGQPVKAGDPLFVVSSASLADLVANQQRARVERDTAQAALRRTQDAVDAQVLPEKELVAARQTLANAELALRLADQKLASLKVRSTGGASFTVTATRDGVVVERLVAVGQTVSPDNGSLIAIADLSSVWVVGDVSGSHLSAVRQGTPARIVLGDGVDADRDATVDQVAAVIDPDRHAVPVRIRIGNPDGALRPNAHVQIRLLDPTPSVAMLPASAVMSDGEKSFVYLENPTGVFRRRNISVGAVFDGRVPVLGGLAMTDRVVVQGAILLDNEIALDQ